MVRKRLLYILKHDPWGVGGGSSASLAYLTAFRRLFHDYQMDVLICDDCMAHQPSGWIGQADFIAVPPRSRLSQYLFVFTGIMHRYQSVAEKLLRENDYAYCVFDHNHIAATLVDYVGHATQSVVIHHNVERNYSADNSASPLKKIFLLPHVVRCEKKAYKKCDFNIFLTAEDMAEFKSLYGATKCACAPVGLFEVNDRPFVPRCNREANPVIVISGSLCNLQNTDGIKFFVEALYPLIPDDITVIVAGKNPLPSISDMLSTLPNVKLIPNPSDMDEIIRQADIYLCPTRLGSGIKVRISDGLRNGLPVIVHSVSARGYGEYVKNGCLFPFDDPMGFKNALDTVLMLRSKKLLCSAHIAELFHSLSSMDAGISRIKNLLQI